MEFPAESFGQIELHFSSPRKWIGLSRTDYPFTLSNCSNCPVLFADANLKYWLSSTASQFEAEAVARSYSRRYDRE